MAASKWIPSSSTVVKTVALFGLFAAMGLNVASLATRFWWQLDYQHMYNDDSGIETIHGGLWQVCTRYLESYEKDMVCRDYNSRIEWLAQIPPMIDWIENVKTSRVLGIMTSSLFFISGLLIGTSYFLKTYKKTVLVFAGVVLIMQSLFEVGAIAVMHHWLRADLNFITYGESFVFACAASGTYGALCVMCIVAACLEKGETKTIDNDIEMEPYSGGRGVDF